MASVGNDKKGEKKFSIWDLPDVPMGQIPEHLQLQKNYVICKLDAPVHTEDINYSGAYLSIGVDNSRGLEHFRRNFRVEVIRLSEDDIEFDMIGIDAAIANAFRRILIAEVPTMAIEKVLIANNTSVIQDEVLSHRLGLIPIKADPRKFEYMSENDHSHERNTIVFKLHVRCERRDGRDNENDLSHERNTIGSKLHVRCERRDGRDNVTSDLLKWLPGGSEFVRETSRQTSTLNPGGSETTTARPETYTSFGCSQDSMPEFHENPIGPKHPDILIAKLGLGQEIELEAHAVKGVGKIHAKWSPVATAWYRMLPEVVLLQEVEDELAEELKDKCPVNVFDIEDLGRGKKRATVARPRACTLCRECVRGEEWDKRISLRRAKDHFIFTVESTGVLPPEVLFTEAVKILEEKCERVITELS